MNGLRIFVLGAVVYGAVRTSGVAWAIGDIGVGIMAWLNIVAILLLSRPALRCLKDYERQLKAKKRPVFIAEECGIKNTELWKKEDVEVMKLQEVV